MKSVIIDLRFGLYALTLGESELIGGAILPEMILALPNDILSDYLKNEPALVDALSRNKTIELIMDRWKEINKQITKLR
jgi:hypothetical protein